jgi:hypothetical protein
VVIPRINILASDNVICGPRKGKLGNKKVKEKMYSLEKEMGTLNSSNVAIVNGRLKKKRVKPPKGDGLELKRAVERFDAEEKKRVDIEAVQQSLGSMVNCPNVENFKKGSLKKIVKNPEPFVESIMQESKEKTTTGRGLIEVENMQQFKLPQWNWLEETRGREITVPPVQPELQTPATPIVEDESCNLFDSNVPVLGCKPKVHKKSKAKKLSAPPAKKEKTAVKPPIESPSIPKVSNTNDGRNWEEPKKDDSDNSLDSCVAVHKSKSKKRDKSKKKSTKSDLAKPVLAHLETEASQVPKDQFITPVPVVGPEPENPEILFDSNIAVQNWKPKKDKKKKKERSPSKKKTPEPTDSPKLWPIESPPTATDQNLLTKDSKVSIAPLKLDLTTDQNSTLPEPSGFLFESGVAVKHQKRQKKKSEKTEANPIPVRTESGVTAFMDDSKNQPDRASKGVDSNLRSNEAVKPKKKKNRRGSNIARAGKKKAHREEGG